MQRLFLLFVLILLFVKNAENNRGTDADCRNYRNGKPIYVCKTR